LRAILFLSIALLVTLTLTFDLNRAPTVAYCKGNISSTFELFLNIPFFCCRSRCVCSAVGDYPSDGIVPTTYLP